MSKKGKDHKDDLLVLDFTDMFKKEEKKPKSKEKKEKEEDEKSKKKKEKEKNKESKKIEEKKESKKKKNKKGGKKEKEKNNNSLIKLEDNAIIGDPDKGLTSSVVDKLINMVISKFEKFEFNYSFKLDGLSLIMYIKAKYNSELLFNGVIDINGDRIKFKGKTSNDKKFKYVFDHDSVLSNFEEVCTKIGKIIEKEIKTSN